MDEEKIKIIAKKLDDLTKEQCPRCDNPDFSVVGFSRIPIDYDLKYQTLSSERTMPTAVTACTKCGCVFMHALKGLGILNELRSV